MRLLCSSSGFALRLAFIRGGESPSSSSVRKDRPLPKDVLRFTDRALPLGVARDYKRMWVGLCE